MTAKQVATTIIEQLRAGGQAKVWSWGAHAWRHGTDEQGNHFLQFAVNGLIHKGHVRVTLMGNDTYTISLTKGAKVVNSTPGIYCDQLTDIVDRQVEFTGKSYKSDLEEFGATFINI